LPPLLFLLALVSLGAELVENRKVHNPVCGDRSEFLVHVPGHADEIIHRL